MKYKDFYKKEVLPKVMKELKLSNIHMVPNIIKIIVNCGVGEAATNKNVLPKAVTDLEVITGQKAVICKARKSVSAFKIRAGQPIGTKVTLRGDKMYYFLEKLIKIVLPRIREFKGVSMKSFDQSGNLNIGLSDQTLFPEIEYDKIDKIRGLEITIVTMSKSIEHAVTLLKVCGMPIVDLEKRN